MEAMRETEKEQREREKQSRKRVMAESHEASASSRREWSIEPNSTKQRLHCQEPVLPP